MFLGGIMNVAFPGLGWPLYVVAILGMLILSAIVYVILYYTLWSPLKCISGIFYGLKTRTRAALVIDGQQRADICSEVDAKAIYDVENPNDFEYDGSLGRINDIPETYFEALVRKLNGFNRTIKLIELIQNEPIPRVGHASVSGCPIEIISDEDSWTIKDGRQYKAIREAVNDWNADNPDDQIFTFAKFQRYVFDRKIAIPKGVRLTTTVDWGRIESSFPISISPALYAGRVREIAARFRDDQKRDIARFAIYILVGSLALAGILLLYKLMIHFL